MNVTGGRGDEWGLISADRYCVQLRGACEGCHHRAPAATAESTFLPSSHVLHPNPKEDFFVMVQRGKNSGCPNTPVTGSGFATNMLGDRGCVTEAFWTINLN